MPNWSGLQFFPSVSQLRVRLLFGTRLADLHLICVNTQKEKVTVNVQGGWTHLVLRDSGEGHLHTQGSAGYLQMLSQEPTDL